MQHLVADLPLGGYALLIERSGYEPFSQAVTLSETGPVAELRPVLRRAAPDLDEVRVHGYGLFLIKHLMDTVAYTPQAGRNHWLLTKNIF